MRRSIVGALWCWLLLAGCSLCAQQSTSTGDVFAGQDPLSVRKMIVPETSLKTCPYTNWKLLAHQDGTCYYVEPLSQRINGYVTDINNVGAVQKLGGRCGVDEFDVTKAVCQNPEDFAGRTPSKGLPPGISPSGGRNDPTTSTGNYRRQLAPPAVDPCHPNYNMSTAAGRAAAQQNAASDNKACDKERCKHNPTLQVCVNIDDSPSDSGGAKGMSETPISGGPADGGPTTTKLGGPPPPPPPRRVQPARKPPSIQLLQKAMNDCLHATLPYWVDRVVQPTSMLEARMATPTSGPFSEDVSQLPPRTQIFLVETAMAIEAQRYHDSLHGPAAGETPQKHKDYLVGWFDNCLADAGLVLPNQYPGPPERNVEGLYANFLGIAATDPRISSFISGYGTYHAKTPPFSLEPPR